MSKVGTISWRELMSAKPEESERFYSELFAWKINSVPYGPTTYRLVHVSVGANEKQIAGIMQFDKPGIAPHWVSYVTVEDVDQTAAKAKARGGTIANAPMDIPNVGRFAVILDPDGAPSVAFKSANPSTETPNATPARGEFVWEHLNSPSPEKSIAFYTQVYGWKSRPQEGDPRMFVLSTEEKMDVCTIMQAPPGMPAHWLTYVVVDKLKDANDRVKRLGGKVITDEIPIPGFGALAVVEDAHGALIGLFEARS